MSKMDGGYIRELLDQMKTKGKIKDFYLIGGNGPAKYNITLNSGNWFAANRREVYLIYLVLEGDNDGP